MIFLGAGASKPYGIPTLKEFSEDAINILRQKGHEKLIQDIQGSLKEFDMPLDFESLYSILEGLTNPVRSVQYSGPFSVFLVRNKRNLPEGYDYSKVLSDLRKIVYYKCSIINNEQTFKKVESYMDQLLEVTKENRCEEKIVGKTGPRSVNIGRIFATTNYDMALELYFLSKEVPITDGYKDTGALVKHFNPLLLSDPYIPENSRGIIKLHGSIWQFLRGNTMMKTKLDPRSNALPFKIRVEREMMIYPTREKDILNYQFFPFFSIFKSIAWTKLLVIGYSFRDEPVNTAIIENMMLNEKSQIIIINPRPDEVLKNLYSNIPENITWRIPKYRIYKFDGKFGSNEVFDYLREIERVSYDQEPPK